MRKVGFILAYCLRSFGLFWWGGQGRAEQPTSQQVFSHRPPSLFPWY
jgi:hypothetical protein